uniref:Uncharacterized protein n=1 Tax=Ciona intestinalis TaxID=7719 RepID=H2XP45_CIOIN
MQNMIRLHLKIKSHLFAKYIYYVMIIQTYNKDFRIGKLNSKVHWAILSKPKYFNYSSVNGTLIIIFYCICTNIMKIQTLRRFLYRPSL